MQLREFGDNFYLGHTYETTASGQNNGPLEAGALPENVYEVALQGGRLQQRQNARSLVGELRALLDEARARDLAADRRGRVAQVDRALEPLERVVARERAAWRRIPRSSGWI